MSSQNFCGFFLLGLLTGWSQLLGQAPPTPAPSSPAFEWGFEERIRSESWNNIIDHSTSTNDQRIHYRFRTRLWGSFQWGPDLQVVAGLCNENRKTLRPENYVYNGREVFFETLYVDYRFHPEWAVRAGRQNIMRGEGFVLFDGNSGDGSRSAYFNAMILTHTWSQSRLELMAIRDPQRERYLPILNEPENPKELIRQNEWDEEALGVYYTAKEWKRTTVEAYGFLKTERYDFRPLSNSQFQPNQKVGILGSRVVQEFGDGWTLQGEGSLERGTRDALPNDPQGSKDIRAWGGYLRIKKSFARSWKPVISVAHIALSGDDPSTRTLEGWDPLFSRWPLCSELYIYSLIPERGVAYWTNQRVWELQAKISPHPKVDLKVGYLDLGAFHPNIPASGVFSQGTHRGGLWQFRADLKFHNTFKSQIAYEHLTPGNFYSGQASGDFLRLEVTYTFTKRVP